MPHTISAELRDCIQQCQTCHSICQETVTHCLREGGKHANPEHIAILLDCTQICATSADFMLRTSASHKEVCDVCATICERCAESCEKIGEDEVLRRCAETCRECANSCHRMAGGTRKAA